MIELSVSLASNGVVKVPGYEQLVRFGYTKNRGVYRLAVTASGEWEGLAIRCFWHVPDGKDPASSLVDGYVAVPASVTAQPGSGCITFEGSDGAKVMTSADLHYRVSANSGTEDGTEPEPGTPAWQQLVDAVHADATAAEQAKTDAQTAAQQADMSASAASTSAAHAGQSAQQAADNLQELKNGIANGDFKGEKGEKGDTGPQGPKGETGPAVALDTTLTHEGEAADAKATGDAISAVKARQNILIGSETGNPLAVDDAFPAPLCGLNVYGRSTQNGTPTPDAPVPIISAGDSGSLTVKVTGKNLWSGKNTEHYWMGNNETVNYECISSDYIPIKGSQTIYAGFSYDWFLGLTCYDSKKNKISGSEQHINDTEENIEKEYRIVPGKAKTPGNTAFIKFMFSKYESKPYVSTVEGKYEPYREQLLTLPTPTGLPGIPVTSGGNYTDSTGQQWVCDEADLTRGVRVQRIYKVDVDGENVKFEQAGEYCNLTQRNLPAALYEVGEKAYCISTLSSLSWYFNKDYFFLYLIAANLADQLNESCKKQLGKVYYALATPIETPLTPDEIAAYKAITTYGPDTVVQAGDGAWVKLEYQRDVNIAIKKLEDAVASMT